MATNVLGGELLACSMDPLTGFYRNGCCDTGAEDLGLHIVCTEVTEAFLDFSLSQGNDLITPVPAHGFPGLRPGDRWCVCMARWTQALEAGAAPRVVLAGTHIGALEWVSLEVLRAHAVDDPTGASPVVVSDVPPSPLGDLEPLRRALEALRGTNSEAMVLIAPSQQPVIEHKGRFGKVKQRPAEYGVQVVHFSDLDGSGVYSIAVQYPDGPPLAQRPGALPPNAVISVDTSSSAGVDLDPSESPATAAARIAQLITVAIAPWAPGPWSVSFDADGTSLGD